MTHIPQTRHACLTPPHALTCHSEAPRGISSACLPATAFLSIHPLTPPQAAGQGGAAHPERRVEGSSGGRPTSFQPVMPVLHHSTPLPVIPRLREESQARAYPPRPSYPSTLFPLPRPQDRAGPLILSAVSKGRAGADSHLPFPSRRGDRTVPFPNNCDINPLT